MGQACSSVCGSPFEDLYGQYGGEFAKVMIAQKSKDIVNEEFGKVTNQSNEIFSGFRNQTDTMVGQKRGELDNIFNDIKGKVNSTVPGGVSGIEKMKGQSVEEFSGYNQLTGQIDQVKTDSFNRIDGEKNKLQGSMQQSKTGMLQQLDNERPKIAVYDDLPEPLRDMVRHEAEEKFGDQLFQNKGAIVNQIQSQFNVGQMGGMFGMLSPETALNGIIGGAAGKFTSALGLGNLGGLAGGLGGLGGLGGIGGGSSGLSGIGNMAGGLFGR